MREGLPKICEGRRGGSRISGGISTWSFNDTDLGGHGLVLSLLRHVAAGYQYRHFHRHVPDRLSYPEYPEPGLQSHAAETGRANPLGKDGKDRAGADGISNGSGTR